LRRLGVAGMRAFRTPHLQHRLGALPASVGCAALAGLRPCTTAAPAAEGQMADEYGRMTSSGETAVFEEFALENSRKLRQAETKYKTWGSLNDRGDNAIVVCHALTGNADLEAWWGPLLGPGKPLDTSKYFIFCANVLGGCYGSTGPTSVDPDTGKRYGGSFPQVTIRDMVRIQAQVLRNLGVKEVVCAIGGSMGGMQVLEWAADIETPYVRSIASLCSSGRHQPWQIGISEVQRQAIFADPLWQNGDYDPQNPPKHGLAVARMMAMLTYRTHPAYWTKFGRATVSGHHQQIFQVENYLRAQGDKFNTRNFDPMTYIILTRAMDSHDLERGRQSYFEVLRSLKQRALVVSVSSDVLYPASEQLELCAHMPNAQHHMIHSDEGHDGFLLEHEKMSTLLYGFLAQQEVPAARL